ncbi:MAG TPA: GNAT family N-acetyltransferase [Chloroflexota bacterium]|nr:GNAT family N-acetyltransferase [Chloroflexota bacterium]
MLHRMALKVEIHPARPEELRGLEMLSGPPEKHRQRLSLQQHDLGIYLVALSDGLPVGHALVKRDGAADEAIASRLQRCPDLEDLFVRPDLRSMGIGSSLLARAEEWARHEGYRCIGLGVGIDNLRAHKLYTGNGYRDSGLGRYPHKVHYHDGKGRHRTRNEVCVYLIKQLA